MRYGKMSPRDREDIRCPEIKADAHFLALELGAFTALPSKRGVGRIQLGLKNAALLLVTLEDAIQLVNELCHDIGLRLEAGIASSGNSRVQPHRSALRDKLRRVENAVGPCRHIGDPDFGNRPKAVFGVE